MRARGDIMHGKKIEAHKTENPGDIVFKQAADNFKNKKGRGYVGPAFKNCLEIIHIKFQDRIQSG
jgi:hypothetical protein